ncbi:MAG: CAP domain-containing protein [Leptolyngbyaceae cyanobacterium MAG.088]|nr:CAP domain-containing protein [Leptolyngbyaceae cyanobacterium MAG.088]
MGFKLVTSTVLLGIVLAGCGGGGGGGGGDSDPPETSNSSAPMSVATPIDVVAEEDCTTLSSILDDLLAETNDIRAANGASNLRFSYQLGQAAQAHAEDMATNDYFSHTSLDGSSIADRIDDSGYIYSSAGENIAAGHDSVEAVVNAWFESPGHRENLLNPDYVDIGFGLSFNSSSEFGSYWVQEFGRPTDATTVDTRAYVPESCSIGTIASDETTVLSGNLMADTATDISVANDQGLEEVLFADVPDDQTSLAATAVMSANIDNPATTPEPALVVGLVSILLGLKFSGKKN